MARSVGCSLSVVSDSDIFRLSFVQMETASLVFLFYSQVSGVEEANETVRR